MLKSCLEVPMKGMMQSMRTVHCVTLIDGQRLAIKVVEILSKVLCGAYNKSCGDSQRSLV